MPSTPYMKLYVGDYLADTGHLTCQEHGAYILLIMAYWQNGGPLENDEKLLRRYTRTTPKEFQKVSKNVLKMFQVRDGLIVHKRIDLELSKRAQVSSASRDSANARWCERNANAMRTQCERNATPIVHSPYSKDKDIKTIPQTFEDFWQAYPRKVGKADATKKYKAILKAGIDHETIMSRLKAYQSQIEAQHTEAQYIRHPARFLNTLDDFESEPPVKNPEPEEREIECVVVTPEFRALIARSYQQPEEEAKAANV